MVRVLITGACGAIGTALLDHLKDTDYEVIGVDKNTADWEHDYHVQQHDLTKEQPLPAADVIVHLAAHSQVQPLIEKPELAVENVKTTERVLRHASDQNATVILASSREVYGSAVQPTEQPIDVEATNPYGASKIASEAFSSAYERCFDVDVITLRFANVYGPHDSNPRVVPIFVTLGLDGEELSVFGDSKILDFVYMGDVVEMLEYTVKHRESLVGSTINIGSGTGTSLSTLAERIVDLIDDCPGYRIEGNRQGDTQKYVTNIEKAQALLDYDPTPLKKGLPCTIDWYRDRDEVRSTIKQRLSK